MLDSLDSYKSYNELGTYSPVVKPLFSMSKALDLVHNTLDKINTVKKVREYGEHPASDLVAHTVVCISEGSCCSL